MDEVLRNTLVANLKAAKTPEETDHALTSAMIALCDCQYKTAQRVKKLTWKVIALSLCSGSGIGVAMSHFDWLAKFFN